MIHRPVSPIVFNSTQSMHEWLANTHFSGPASVYDGWTWGPIHVEPRTDGKPGYSSWWTISDETDVRLTYSE